MFDLVPGKRTPRRFDMLASWEVDVMKTGPDRKYTEGFREAAVRQVLDGQRTLVEVARSLEMPHKTLETWVSRARRGQALLKHPPAPPVDDVQAELSRLRQENARLKMEKEILKKAAAYFAKEST
jgi:transposase